MPDRYEPPEPSSSDRRVVAIETVERAVLARRRQQRHELRQFGIRLGLLLGALLAVMLAGAIAYSVDEHTSFGFGLYWTLDAVTTLGVLPAPKNVAGRLILVGLELLGIGTLFYGLATVAEFFVSGQFSTLMGARRTQKMIDSYSDHYIVCGYGRVGRQVAHDLLDKKAQIVVIDHNPMHREAATADGVAYIEGHASDDDVLTEAGIERASAVIACVDSDAENIFIALSARELSNKVKVIARASADDAERKLIRAGANEVISPYKISGSEMARLALAPAVGT
ncbi:MAG TPA: potassium channel family protein [Solirubrobacteraceae bacterium]|jgi:voltage-gated potassium channel|nr:potassium channel family protein [Solirubrobacteraceae bacterium]